MTFQYKGYLCGLMICYDGDFPEMTRSYAHLGCSILFWMNNRGSRGHSEVKDLAYRNSMIIAASCCCGLDESGNLCRGGSNITDAAGELLAEIWDDEGIILARVDPDAAIALRKENPWYRGCRPELYSQSDKLVSEILRLWYMITGSFMLNLLQEKDMTNQSSVQIGNVIRNAVVFNVKNWYGDTMNPDLLLGSVEHLFALLESRKVQYALVGGIALLRYIEGRNTEDIDLIMALSSLQKIPEIEIENQDLYFVRGKLGELQIDILLTENPLFQKVQYDYIVYSTLFGSGNPVFHHRRFVVIEIVCASISLSPGKFRAGWYL